MDNLIESEDSRTDKTSYCYNKLGQLQRAGLECFAFIPSDCIARCRKIGNIENDIIKRNQEIKTTPVAYGYDELGNLTESHTSFPYKPFEAAQQTRYHYDNLGRITRMESQGHSWHHQDFYFDPAHNLVNHPTEKVSDNRVINYQGIRFSYDGLGNLIESQSSGDDYQRYTYDLKNRLIKAEIYNRYRQEVWGYDYDPLGRRIAKWKLNKRGEKALHRQFIWDGSHLVQEIRKDHKNTQESDRTFTYIYRHPDSYEPLAQCYKTETTETEAENVPHIVNYFHCDQIGMPREMTDSEGKLIWRGRYDAWGSLIRDNFLKTTPDSHQPFRLQNQYFDEETGLHYNFFRYYEPILGRFTTQDPIGLQGGMNLYRFAPSVQQWTDVYGLSADASKILPYNWENSYSKSVAMTEIMSRAKLNPKETQTCEVSLPIPKRSVTAGTGITSELQQCVYYTVCDTVHSVGNSPKFTVAHSIANSAMQTGESEANCTAITSPGINIKKVPVSVTISGCSSPDGSRSTSKGLSLGSQKGGIEVSQCRTVSRCSSAVKF